MDMSKAFDMVEWTELFLTLIKKRVSYIILRLMLYIYENQYCAVKWAGAYSDTFKVSNGVRQGAVSSAILFAVYIDELLQILKCSRIGCHIDRVFLGAFIFADDILLLSASRAGLQSMVNTCEKFASRKNLKFGTNSNPMKSKTKCIVFTKKRKNYLNLAPIKLDGSDLPWVRKVTHLGCILEDDNLMRADILSKRAQFIAKVNSLIQELHLVESSTMIGMLPHFMAQVYGTCVQMNVASSSILGVLPCETF